MIDKLESIAFKIRYLIPIIISFGIAVFFTLITIGIPLCAVFCHRNGDTIINLMGSSFILIPLLIISLLSWKCTADLILMSKKIRQEQPEPLFTQNAREVKDLELLRKSGALTDGEFNIAKWNILSRTK